MPRRRKKLALATPSEITTAIYSLATRGKQARSHIEPELRQIIAAAKSQLADYQKGKENHKRHKKRNPNWPSSIRAAEWFRTHRREARDEPRQASPATEGQQGGQEEREWKSLAEYEAWIHQPAAAKASSTPTETEAERVYRMNTEMCQAEDREREAKRLGVSVDDLD